MNVLKPLKSVNLKKLKKSNSNCEVRFFKVVIISLNQRSFLPILDDQQMDFYSFVLKHEL